jgi:hypothetical protein
VESSSSDASTIDISGSSALSGYIDHNVALVMAFGPVIIRVGEFELFPKRWAILCLYLPERSSKLSQFYICSNDRGSPLQTPDRDPAMAADIIGDSYASVASGDVPWSVRCHKGPNGFWANHKADGVNYCNRDLRDEDQ